MGKVIVIDDAAVAGHSEEQSADTGYAGICAVDEADAEHQAENSGGSSTLCCLKNKLDDGHASWSGQDGLGVDKAEEHNKNKGETAEVDLLTKF